MQDLDTEHYNILLREIAGVLNKLRQTMFMDWNTQYSHQFSQNDLKIQCIPNQNLSWYFR